VAIIDGCATWDDAAGEWAGNLRDRLVAGVRSSAASRVTSMTVFSNAAWGSSDGNVAGRLPGVRANSLISCASARLTGWSRGMGVKPAWLWRWRVGRPASAIPKPGDRGAGGS